MSERIIKFKLTRAGMRAVWNATSTGVKLELSHIAVGSGLSAPGGVPGYEPAGAETALRGEFQRVAIGGGEQVADTEILVEALLEGAGVGWVHEMGVFGRPENATDAPILFAIWSEVNAPLFYKSANVPAIVAGTLSLTEIPPNAVTVVAGGPNVSITLAGPVADMSAEIIRLQHRAIAAEVTRLVPMLLAIHH